MEVLDAPASPADIMPPKVRRSIPKSRLLFTLALWLTQAYMWLRFGSRPLPPKQLRHRHLSWALTPDQTARLRSRCKAEGVSVQAAICTAFLPAFSAIHTPVSLRTALARPVGESVGLYVGAAEVSMKHQPARGFWDNARRFHRRLRKAQGAAQPLRDLPALLQGGPRRARSPTGPPHGPNRQRPAALRRHQPRSTRRERPARPAPNRQPSNGAPGRVLVKVCPKEGAAWLSRPSEQNRIPDRDFSFRASPRAAPGAGGPGRRGRWPWTAAPWRTASATRRAARTPRPR